MENELNKNRICIGDNAIYFLKYINNSLSVIKIEVINSSFIITKKYKNIYGEKDIDDSNNLSLDELNITYNNDNIIFYFKDYLYILKEK